MFFKKKEEKDSLPDLPPMPIESFQPKRPERIEVKGLDGTFGKISSIKKDEIEEKEVLDEEITNERHALPSFPDSPTSKGFSQSAIRNAVDDSGSDLPELPEIDEVPKIKEIEEKPLKFKTIEAEAMYNPTSIREIPKKREEFKPAEKNQDIYVKLDKFRAGRKSLGEVKTRLSEIDSLLKKIRETKMREEQELSGWESELNFIKDRLKDVTENIFEKA